MFGAQRMLEKEIPLGLRYSSEGYLPEQRNIGMGFKHVNCGHW